MANPLVRLEFMRRFRTPAAAWGIPLAMVLPGLAVIAMYGTTVAANDWVGGNMDVGAVGMEPQVQNAVGLGMFSTVASMLMLTLIVLVPAFVGGSIAGERHSQTLQPLQLTAMTPGQIVWGKFVSSLAYLMLIILCVSPVIVVPFLLGGIPASTVIGSYLAIFVICFEFAAVSLAVSAITSRPATAIVAALLVVGFIVLAPIIATGLAMALAAADGRGFQADQSVLKYISTISPISIGSLVPIPKPNDIRFINGAYQVLSVIWFLTISSLSLLLARRGVTAPVERDR